ncbi:MAG: hypothetical protein GHCLOJNM_02570 [bacterium]|nr:hypothetical protein [bacterium]
MPKAPAFGSEVDLTFTWNRKPDLWAFDGRLWIHAVENVASLSHLPLLQDYPEAALALVYVEEAKTLTVSGSLPPGGGKGVWRVQLETVQGHAYDLALEVDPTTVPWSASASLTDITLPVEEALGYLPLGEEVPSVTGELQVKRLSASGRIGEWDRWRFGVNASTRIDDLYVPPLDRYLAGLTLDLALEGTLEEWAGTVSGSIEQIDARPIPDPLRGFSTQGFEVNVSLPKKRFSIKGPWSLDDAVGSAVSGTLDYKSSGALRLEGRIKGLNLVRLHTSLGGKGEVFFDLAGNVLEETPFALSARMSSGSLIWGSQDLSQHTAEVRATARASKEGKLEWTHVETRWGRALEVELSDLHAGADKLEVGRATLSGDLAALSQFAPSPASNKEVWKWIHPRDWSLDGGIEITLLPALGIHARNAEFDTGRGLKGPISFSYASDTREWTFRSPVLRFALDQAVKGLAMGRLDIEGDLLASLDLSGRVPQEGKPGPWIMSGILNGEIKGANGLVLGPGGKAPGEPAWCSWRDLNGTIEARWAEGEITRLQASLFAKRWVFFTRHPMHDRPYPESLPTQASLEILVTKNPGQPYTVRDGKVVLGDVSPIVVELRGTVDQRGGDWLAELDVRGTGNGASATPVFRGVRMGGTGTLLGKLTSEPGGRVIFNGDLHCTGLDFEQVAVPVLLKNCRGVFYLRDVRLDELLDPTRFERVRRSPPLERDQPEALSEAFERSKKSPVNLEISHATVGLGRYSELSLRTIVQGEVLYLNTAEGVFAEGGYPLRFTGFVYAHPGMGPVWSIRGLTERVPLTIAVPGLFDSVGISERALRVDFYLVRKPPGPSIQTRLIELDFPIGRLRDLPGIGRLLFRWTPDSLGVQTLIVQKVDNGDWRIINPFEIPEGSEIPSFLFLEVPKRIFAPIRDKGKDFLEGVGGGIRSFIRGDE